jgi:hypothetical protein
MTREQIVMNATVRTKTGGQGVLIPGHMVTTAAHCIKWNGDGAMALGDYFIENITTKSGLQLRVTPLAIDPVSDIAVLGALDYQEFGSDVDAYEQWCEDTQPVPLMMTPPAPRKFPHGFNSLAVRILSHRGVWISGKLTNTSMDLQPRMAFEGEKIEGGTSGGPIINSAGELVAIVSTSGERDGEQGCSGPQPIPCLALPHWVLLRIAKAQPKARARRRAG